MMPDKQTKGKAIADFLTAKSFAVIGVSANRRKFGNALFRAMRDQGLSVVPVHKTLDRVEGAKCYHALAELRGKVEAVVTVVPPAETEWLVGECAGTGIRRIWMQQGSSSDRAIALAREQGMEVVHGECLLMFLEPVRSIHAFHRWMKKLVGRYPRPTRA
jgi:predicted CoA-binding protein